MSNLWTRELVVDNDSEVVDALSRELTERLAGTLESDFLETIRCLPRGLRAMAATHQLDVSLALDDLGWHFGNWHDLELAEETARGLEELGAGDLAAIFREALRHAKNYWSELGSEDWTSWYHGSELEAAVMPLNKRAWALLEDKQEGLLSYWAEYARQYPENVAARHDA